LVVGVGIDVVDIPDFRAGLEDDRLGDFYLPGEIAYARTQARSWENLGARLAAKRAVLKAIGADTDVATPWLDVEVVRCDSGELDVRLSGAVLERANALGVSECRLSMSHTGRTAVAVAILESGSE
jgi:holo-[acyl-carrier protein] synthase